jgi:protein O-mannosyl-transferase
MHLNAHIPLPAHQTAAHYPTSPGTGRIVNVLEQTPRSTHSRFGGEPLFRSKQALWLAVILLAVCAVYSNSFGNSFHFDDFHTIVDNPSIRNLRNVPRFFIDATTFSVLPANRTYRPFVSASLALDYALGHGYHVFWFHLSTFIVFLLQLCAMYILFKTIAVVARPQPEANSANEIVSLLAIAWYGLHPAMAETINYIIQRGDVYCAFGVVAALVVYVRFPRLRSTGFYLLPFVFAMLSKPPAVVFPVLLFFYVVMFELNDKSRNAKAILAAVPSSLLCVLLIGVQSTMTPKTFTQSTLSSYAYCVTQPFVLLRYFGWFFLPIRLNVDTDLQPFNSLSSVALWGFLFVAALITIIWLTARKRILRPISYGLLWFLIASLPTSLYRLSEVENDHRMFLPFIGLVLAVTWAAYLGLEALAARMGRSIVWRAAAAAMITVLASYAYGAHLRNRVWHTDESLWLDDVQKCPHNGRGLMNYGLTQMAQGAYPVALDYFLRALVYTPNYKTLEVNLGIVYGAMNRDAEAEQHFQRALSLGDRDDEVHYYYGRWLFQSGRVAEAVQQLEMAVRLNPSRLLSRDLLATAYANTGDLADARSTAEETLRAAPDDSAARDLLAHGPTPSADYWVETSLIQYRRGNYQACIEAARQALKIKPDSAEAYNNIGAAYAGMRQWDLAIESEHEALRIRPKLEISKNNLALYTAEKNQESIDPPTNRTAEDWLNASLRDNQAGRFEQSIQDARAALRLKPDYAEAYNNIAADYASMQNWSHAVSAAQIAVHLKPDFQLAKNNLAWAEAEKAKAHPAAH